MKVLLFSGTHEHSAADDWLPVMTVKGPLVPSLQSLQTNYSSGVGFDTQMC